MNNPYATEAPALGDRDELRPADPEVLGSFVESRTTFIHGDMPSFIGAVPGRASVIIGQGSDPKNPKVVVVGTQQVITLIDRVSMLERKLVRKDRMRTDSPLVVKESRSQEYDKDSIRQVTVPAGHEIQPIEQASNSAPSVFIANVIDGSPTGPAVKVFQLRFFLQASGAVRVVVTGYSAQGKAQIRRLSPTELTVVMA
jgi:hypothetical protein